MDYKSEIGARIRRARTDKNLTLEELSVKTGDLLTLKRINAYENGDRMPGPAEVVTLAKALQVRPAFLMAIDDTQLPISAQEEALVRNWRTLNERDRMEFFRKIQTMALQNRDPMPDQVVGMHIPVPRPLKQAALKRVRRK